LQKRECRQSPTGPPGSRGGESLERREWSLEREAAAPWSVKIRRTGAKKSKRVAQPAGELYLYALEEPSCIQ